MRGITLIELLIVIALVLIVSAMGPIFYSRFLLQNAVEDTANQISGSLRKAQTYAMMGKQGSAWSLNYSSNTLTLYKGTNFALRDSSFDEKFDINPNVTISGTDISFAKVTGLPTPSSATITITSGNNSKTLTVNNQGVVSRQ